MTQFEFLFDSCILPGNDFSHGCFSFTEFLGVNVMPRNWPLSETSYLNVGEDMKLHLLTVSSAC